MTHIHRTDPALAQAAENAVFALMDANPGRKASVLVELLEVVIDGLLASFGSDSVAGNLEIAASSLRANPRDQLSLGTKQ